jgi:hypothetical protein
MKNTCTRLKYRQHRSSVTTESFPPEKATRHESLIRLAALMGSNKSRDKA